jgi:ribosomal protein S18 acetylase RimI-like enzyme
MRGYLAYDENKPVGWSNANNKNNYQSFAGENISQSILCSIVCFLISPDYRRKGIAQKILDHISNEYTLKGYDYIEAYPRKDRYSCERNYHGHFSLYEKFNFILEEEYDDHYVVRKKLKN